MRTKLADIVESHNLPSEAVVAFREAETCFRAGGFRSALLFSYAGWGLILRSRLLPATVPQGIHQGQWDGYLSNLRDEDKWDSQVFDLTQMRVPAPVFLISEDLRRQVRYWKDRRNDCAHFKKNEIDYTHVESFWLFLYSNLGKFVPNGSSQSLLNELATHFDPNLTPPDTSVDPIASRVPLCVENAEIVDFLERVVAELAGDLAARQSGKLWMLAELVESIMRQCDFDTIAKTAEFLLREPAYLNALLDRDARYVTVLQGNLELTRQLWRQHLLPHFHPYLPVYAALLRNDLIPQEQIEEANRHVLEESRGEIPRPNDVEVLQQGGFMSMFEQVAFVDCWLDKFAWANNNKQLLVWYLERYPLSEEAVRTICSVFSSMNYPWHAQEALSAFFGESPQKRTELLEVAERLEQDVPPSILRVPGD